MFRVQTNLPVVMLSYIHANLLLLYLFSVIFFEIGLSPYQILPFTCAMAKIMHRDNFEISKENLKDLIIMLSVKFILNFVVCVFCLCIGDEACTHNCITHLPIQSYCQLDQNNLWGAGYKDVYDYFI